MFHHINVTAIAAATIANMVLGMLWYSPLLFGATWMRAHGFTDKDLNAGPAHFIGGALVGMTFALGINHILHLHHVTHMVDAIRVALTVTMAFVATTSFSAVIWEKKPLNLFFIGIGYWATSAVMIAAIILQLS